MKVDREKLLSALRVSAVGAALPPRMVVCEQSDCFLFEKGQLITFSDEIAVRQPSPLDFDVVVVAQDLLRVLDKIPDKEIEVRLKNKELLVQGLRRTYGLTTQAEVKLPYQDLPTPVHWHKIGEGTAGMLKQAARTCGKDVANPMTMVVHVTPERVEACDNFRLFRAKLPTGFPRPVLIPAFDLALLDSLKLRKVSLTKGWVHFRGPGKALISVKLVVDDFIDLDAGLRLKNPERVALPENLAEILARSEVMNEGADPIVQVEITEGVLSIRAEKEQGWYRETKKIAYKGRDLRFHMNPKYLAEALQRSNKVMVSKDKMKLTTEGVEFVVSLEVHEAKTKKPKRGKAGTKKVER